MRKSRLICWAVGLLAVGLWGCSPIVPVTVTAYKRVAVLDFKAPPDSPQIGARAANVMISKLLARGQYQLVERSEIDQILREHQLTSPDPKDTATLQKIGTLLKVDALLVGTVSTYRVERYEGKEAVALVLKDYSVSVKTGEKSEITVGEKGKVVPSGKEKKEYETKTTTGTTREESATVTARTVLVEQIQVAKRGTVSMDFRMFDVRTGRILQAKDQSDTAYFLATTPEEALYLPGDDEILDGVLRNIVNYFIRWVSPSAMGMTRGLHKGKKDQLVERGVLYAQKGLWEEAMEQWQTAINLKASNAYAHNNLGVAYERAGQYEEAIKEYQTALKIMPGEPLFMDNLARARRDEAERKGE